MAIGAAAVTLPGAARADLAIGSDHRRAAQPASADEPSLVLILSAASASSRGFWEGTAELTGATAPAVTVTTYAAAGCTGQPTSMQPAEAGAAGGTRWSVRGPTPPGTRSFSVRVTATTTRGALLSGCRTVPVAGPLTRAIGPSAPVSTAVASRPTLTITPAHNPFPSNVLWSGTLALSGGVAPGGSVTVIDYSGTSCSGQSDWQTSVSFTSGTDVHDQRVLGYALPNAGTYSVLAQYPGDADNAAVSSACVTYTVATQGTGDTLSLSLPSSNGVPDQLMSIATQVGGLSASAPSIVDVDQTASGCAAPALTTWSYPVGDQAATTLTTSFTVPQPGSYGLSATLFPTADDSGVTTPCNAFTVNASGNNSSGDYFGLPPFRVLDTRNGTGSAAAPVPPGGVITVQVTGVAGSGVPPTGVSAVVLNLTVDGPSDAGFLTVWPAGVARPFVSNLNFTTGQTIASLATVRVGAGGQVSIYNNSGSVSVIADVLGYYSDGSTSAGSRLTTTTPFRILDTRTGQGTATSAPLSPTATMNLAVSGVNGIPADVTAVVLNVTVTDTTAPSYLTVWPSGAGRPTASNLNWTAGRTIPNEVVATVGAGGSVSIFNLSGRTDVVADVTGWYRDASADPAGLQYFAVSPVRELDTRSCRFVATSWATQVAGCPQALGQGTSSGAFVVGDGVPVTATAVLANTAVTNTTFASYLTVWPGGQDRPLASSLNWAAGDTVANLVLTAVGNGFDGPGEAFLYNYSGATDVVMDVGGYFQAPSSGGSTPTAQAINLSGTPTGSHPFDWGVYIAATQAESDTFPNMSLINDVEQGSGQHMSTVMWYVKWGDSQTGAWNAKAVDDVLAHGSIPQISWQSDQPYDYNDPAYSDSAIAGGSQDTYLHSWASGVKAAPGTVQLRLDYEMNGSWSPWAPGNNGNTASSFIAMWRHVHDLFASDGVTNVQWLWTPNTDFPAAIPMASLYPGDAYVDWLGMDGYNHIPFNPDGQWDSPSTVFDQTLAELNTISSKPLMISEVGCAEVGGDKAQWIGELFAYMRAHPRIHNFTWFDINKETDWRIDSSWTSQAAFAAGLQGGNTARDVSCSQQVQSTFSAIGQLDPLVSARLSRPVYVSGVPVSC
jgi:hypothetical protein